MNKLTAEKCREMFLHLFEEKRQDGITLKEDLYLQALEIALPILEQQEGGDGWIEWGGGDRPVHAHVKVEVKHRDSLCASTVSRAHNFDWNHYGYKFGPDIIAYRIIPESSDEN